MTGRRIENKPVRELLGLSENTVQSMKLVKEGYFEDSPYMLAALDTLLGNKDFYLSMEQAANWYGKKEQAPDDMKEFCEWKAAQYMPVSYTHLSRFRYTFLQGKFGNI